MFRKKALLSIGILLLGSFLAAQQGNGLIKEIYLIKNLAIKYVTPPLEIRIGINMAAPAYYKLSNEDVILSAGLLPKGENSLSIPTKTFFEKKAKHTFSLELKTEKRITRKDIILDVQLAIMESPKKIEAKPDIHEHKLSLYIENQIVTTRIKHMDKKIPVQMELPPLPENYDPFKPKQRDDLMSDTVSIFAAIGLAYHLIKSATQKKDRDESSPTIQHTHSFSIKFLRKNPQGVEEEVIAMIGLTTK